MTADTEPAFTDGQDDIILENQMILFDFLTPFLASRRMHRTR